MSSPGRDSLDRKLREAERRNDEEAIQVAIGEILAVGKWRPLDAFLARLDQIAEPASWQVALKLDLAHALAELTRAVECYCVEETEDGQHWRDCGRCAGSGKVPPRDPPPNPVHRWLGYASQLMGQEEARRGLEGYWQTSAGLDRDTIDRLWRLLDGEELSTMEARRLAWRGWAVITDVGEVMLGPVAPPLPEAGAIEDSV